jgi:trigger factor
MLRWDLSSICAAPEALADSINEVVSSALEKYIKDNELNLLGEPIPSEEEDKNDWNNPDKFSFSFDMGLAPKIDFDVTKDDSIPYYDIKTDDKAVADYRESMLRRFGKLEDADVSGEESFMTLNMEQGDRKLEDVYITLPRIADKGQRAVFIGKKKGDSFDVDMTSTFPDETERANVLRVKKEELASIDPVWKASVVQIKIFVKAEPTQEIFDQLFEKGTVTCEEEFAAKIRDALLLSTAMSPISGSSRMCVHIT